MNLPTKHAAFVALILVASACSQPQTRLSDVALASAGRWQRARVEITYKRGGTRSASHGGAGGHFVAAEVGHVLHLERDADPINPGSFILAHAFEDVVGHATFSKLRNAEYVLRFSGDGNALAISTTGGARWTIFELEHVAGQFNEPFYCRHRTVSSLSPWPSSRSVVLEVLSEASPTSTSDAHKAPQDPEWPSLTHVAPGSISFIYELRAAVLYACLHKEDSELRGAVVDAYLQPGNSGFDSWGGSDSIIPRCIADIARQDPATLTRIRAVVAAGTGDVTHSLDFGRAASTLRSLDEPNR